MSDALEEEVVAFLSPRIDATKVIATHISLVIIGADHVFKLKRAVQLPYLDFSSSTQRLEMCQREFALNRRFAPHLYLGVRRLTREADGSLALDGAGQFVDAVIEMRRFPDDALFDAMARDGRLTPEIIEKLARRIATFHDASAPDAKRGGAASMGEVIDGMAASLRDAAPAPVEEVEAHIAALRSALAANAPLIDRRRAEGRVRPCHGDLNLRNICLFEGEPTLFDCIEFSDDMSTIDILYDLAFLLMDLSRAGAPGLANIALNRYLDTRREDDKEGLPLLPFYMSLRATIRAHVEAAQNHAVVAAEYFDLARRLLTPPQRAIIAIGGLSGSGKSSVAAALAPLLTPAPGARILNSDRLRKRLFGAAPTDRLPAEAYASEISQQIYAELFAAAARNARAGWPVIVDAVFDRPQDRSSIESAARQAGTPFLGVWLDVDLDQRLARVERRVNDVSDATRAVLESQMAKETGEIGWLRIDARQEAQKIAGDIHAALNM